MIPWAASENFRRPSIQIPSSAAGKILRF